MGGWARLPHTGGEVLAAPRGLIKCPGSDLVKSATRKKNKKQTIQYDETGGIQNTVDTYRVTGGIHETKKRWSVPPLLVLSFWAQMNDYLWYSVCQQIFLRGLISGFRLPATHIPT